jgi:hypothetical protein
MDDPNDSPESAEPQAIGFVRKAMESIQEHLAAGRPLLGLQAPMLFRG